MSLQLSAFGFAQTLSLSDALTRLPQSPDWQSAELSYLSSQRSLEAAQVATGLKLSGSGDYSLNNPINPAGDSTQSLKLGATALVGVLPWSSAFDSVRSAERALYRAALDRRDARNTLVVNLSSQYFSARQKAGDNAVAQATLKLRENQLRVAEAKYQSGQSSFEDLLTAQQNLETARVNAVSAAGSLEVARQTLANTLGISPAALGDLSTAPKEPDLPGGSLESLITQAQNQRPDVLKAQSRLQDGEASLNSAQRDRWLPEASLSLSYSERTSTDSGTSVSAGLNFKNGNASLSASYPLVSSTSGTQSSSLSLGLSVALPIIAPSSDAQVTSAQTSLDSLKLSLESAKRSAELDVRQKYLEAQTAKAKVGIAKAALATASKSLETAEARLKAGTATALDQQNASVNQQQAQADLDSAIANAQIAILKLQNALGLDLIGGN